MKQKILALSSVVFSALILGIGLAQSQPQVVCTDWTQVNEDAFGLGAGVDGDYTSEESFEAAVFQNQMYLGMEADNSLGARLWRTRKGISVPQSQADWEEVAADEQGNPFGIPDPVQIDHIDSLIAFNGYLYASSANRSGYPSGFRLFRSTSGNPVSWEDGLATYGPGFGDSNNENFKDMQLFEGSICGGTWNFHTGAQVWCSNDGSNWEQKNTSGFGNQSNDPSNAMIWSGGVFKDSLYFGVENVGSDPNSAADDVASVYRLADVDSNQWVEVLEGAPGSGKADILGELDGYLYISTESSQGMLIFRSKSGDPGSWIQANLPGMGNPNNEGTVVDGATAYNGALYVSITNWDSGVEIWRTAGIQRSEDVQVDWTLVRGGGISDNANTRAHLISFNRHLYAWTSNFTSGQQVLVSACPSAKNVIVFIGDGMGPKHIEAAWKYTGSPPIYETWRKYWMATYPEAGRYDPTQAWNDFDYVTGGVTDSAAAATAMFTGMKTANRRISVSSDNTMRFFSLADKARKLNKGVGAVTSVYLSHATPGAWYAHNDLRSNGYAIADEGLWGDPNTTGDPSIDPRYAGGHGPSLPPLDVIMGAGHPNWNGGDYVNQAMVEKLLQEASFSDELEFVQRVTGNPDGGERLMQAADNPETNRLVGLFGGPDGNLEFRLADGSGFHPENPTLAEMAVAAAVMLSRNPRGFVMMVEGGAIDWASHDNNMDQMLGEMLDFNDAVQAIVDWIEDPINDVSWDNTLVMVTGDHETGYLTAAPGVFQDQQLGEINQETIKMEKTVAGSGITASWMDTHNVGVIDSDESVYWAWNIQGHTNSLIPLYAKGVGAGFFDYYSSGSDPIRGQYIDNTTVQTALDAVLLQVDPIASTMYFPVILK